VSKYLKEKLGTEDNIYTGSDCCTTSTRNWIRFITDVQLPAESQFEQQASTKYYRISSTFMHLCSFDQELLLRWVHTAWGKLLCEW